MTLRLMLQGGPRDGHVTTLTYATPREPPDSLFVYRWNPGLILASAPERDPATLDEILVVYRRTGRQTAEGVEIYSCLP